MIVFFTKSTSAGQFEVLLAPFSVASRNNYLLGIFPVALSVAAHPLRHGLQRVRLMGGFATLLRVVPKDGRARRAMDGLNERLLDQLRRVVETKSGRWARRRWFRVRR